MSREYYIHWRKTNDMTLFSGLSVAAILFFVAHVALLLMSFPKSGFHKGRYLWSHITLWICGALVCWMAATGQSSLSEVFDTTTKRLLILVGFFALSGIAHLVVRYLVLGKAARQ